ncbi:MAG: AmmeMemoRadiSam system protein A, partial [Proteobacteria bacterium SW_6_67_9]
LAHGTPPEVDLRRLDPALQAERATFVTLLDGQGGLRGCIGSIEANRPIALDVSAHAFAAAFQDPRFPPLTRAEHGDIQCKLSVLTPLEAIDFTDEADLIRQLEPGADGVLIEAGERRGTLLPQVWSDLPEPKAFWQTLKRKADLGDNEWPRDLRAYRYRAESLG